MAYILPAHMAGGATGPPSKYQAAQSTLTHRTHYECAVVTGTSRGETNLWSVGTVLIHNSGTYQLFPSPRNFNNFITIRLTRHDSFSCSF